MQQKTYRIGEAAKLLNLKTYVLRFWETEFAQLDPHRTETGQRLYSETDVMLLKAIRHLLHERGMTIEGARKSLAENPAIVQEFARKNAQPAGPNDGHAEYTSATTSGEQPLLTANAQVADTAPPHVQPAPQEPDQHLLPVQGINMTGQERADMKCPPHASMQSPHFSGGHESPPENKACKAELMNEVISELETLRDFLKHGR